MVLWTSRAQGENNQYLSLMSKTQEQKTCFGQQEPWTSKIQGHNLEGVAHKVGERPPKTWGDALTTLGRGPQKLGESTQHELGARKGKNEE
jgi:hypothetical protein